MLSTLNNTQKGFLYAAFGFSSFAIADACAKWLAQSYPIMQVVAFMYVFSLLFCLLASPFLGGIKATLKTGKAKIHAARSVCNLFVAVLAVQCFAHLPLTTIYTVLFLSPFIITILAIPLYKEHVPLKNWLIIIIGFSGVLVAFPPGLSNINPWIFVAFSTALFISLLGLLARPLDNKETILSLSFYPNLLSVLIFLPYALINYPLPEIHDLPLFALAGILLTAGLSGVASGYRTARYCAIAPLHYTQMIWGIILGYIIFGDIPNFKTMLGACIIIGSGLYLIYRESKSGHEDEPPWI